MQALLGCLFSLAILGYVAEPATLQLIDKSPECFQCAGCVASRVSNPNAVPPITAGVQKLQVAAGVNLVVALLTTKSGSCVLVDTPEGVICAPSANCEFTATYSLTYANGTFHNNNVPCEWSQPIGGNQTLASSIRWLSACNNTSTWATAQCFSFAPPPVGGCNDGASILEVKFIGHCGVCTESSGS